HRLSVSGPHAPARHAPGDQPGLVPSGDQPVAGRPARPGSPAAPLTTSARRAVPRLLLGMTAPSGSALTWPELAPPPPRRVSGSVRGGSRKVTQLDLCEPAAAETARSAPIRCGISDRQFGTPARPPMARPEDRTYHSDVVGESGAGVQRSTAIVVFTDLVGSTELRSRLGEDAAEELRRKHDRS